MHEDVASNLLLLIAAGSGQRIRYSARRVERLAWPDILHETFALPTLETFVILSASECLSTT